MLTTAQRENLKTLYCLLDNIPDEMYKADQFGDNVSGIGVFAMSPSKWTGPSCALGHAFKSGLFPGLRLSVNALDCDEEVFGHIADEFHSYRQSTDPKIARREMLQKISAALEESEELAT